MLYTLIHIIIMQTIVYQNAVLLDVRYYCLECSMSIIFNKWNAYTQYAYRYIM